MPLLLPDASAANLAPYFSPTYFPLAYFYRAGGGASSVPLPVVGRSPYYAPAYFPAAYFYIVPAAPAAPIRVAGPTTGRDGPCYAALVARLQALGAFDAVIFDDPSRRGAAGADSHPLAVITPKGWEEDDDTDPILAVRRVRFAIRVVVRVEDAAPFDRLDRLAALVESRVNGADLGDDCIPALTRIRAGRYEPSARYPEWSVELDGEFAVLVDPTAGPLVF